MEEIIKLLESERNNIEATGDKLSICKLKYINNYIRYIKNYNKCDYNIDKEYFTLYDRFRDNYTIFTFLAYFVLIYNIVNIGVLIPSILMGISFAFIIYFRLVDKNRFSKNEIIYKMNIKETKEFVKYDKYIKELINNKLNVIDNKKVNGMIENDIIYLKEYLKNLRDCLDNMNHNENKNIYKTSEEELLYRELGLSYDDRTERVNEEVISKIKKLR